MAKRRYNLDKCSPPHTPDRSLVAIKMNPTHAKNVPANAVCSWGHHHMGLGPATGARQVPLPGLCLHFCGRRNDSAIAILRRHGSCSKAELAILANHTRSMLHYWEAKPYAYHVDMDGCQNHGPLLDPLSTRCLIMIRTPKGTIILTTTQMHL